jgi:Zn-dependent protease with chaperone function
VHVGYERDPPRGGPVALYSVRGMEGHRSRLPLAILVAAVAAGAATLILRPRGGLIDPASVEKTAYFSAKQLKRAEDFRGPQRLLGLAGIGVSGAALAVLAFRPPGPARRAFERAGRRPILGAAAAGAGISVVLVAVGLPLAAVSHERSVDVGLSTQDWGPWLGDVGKFTAVQAVFAGLGGAVAIGLVRRFRRHWWAPAAVLLVAFGVLAIYLFPVVIDPIFNRFEPLPDGKLRSEVLALARKSGVDVGQVYRVDASRRTTGANAYVNGLGHTKRVVLYDTLIDRFPPDQVRSVVAHELGHVKHHDVPRGLLWLALVAPAGTFLTQQVAELLGRRSGLGAARVRPGPAAIPAIALAAGVVSLALTGASNVLSRRVEASADAYALRLTADPRAFIGLERRLSISNVADPDPPRLLQDLFGTHPTTIQRIGVGEAFARRR